MKTYLLATAILGALATGCFFASLSAPATELLARIGIDPWESWPFLAGLGAICLILAVSPSLRALTRDAYERARNALRQPTPESDRIPHYKNLDILRLLMAGTVVVMHCWSATGHTGDIPFPYNPVAAFICISGFVIPNSLTSSKNAWHFGWKRFLRIGPALLVCFLLIALTMGHAAFTGSLLLYLSAGTIMTNALTTDAALWSLVPEEVLYAGHVAARTLQGFWTPLTILSAIGACCLLNPVVSHLHNTGPRFMVLAVSFLLGNLLYLFRDCITRLSFRAYLMIGVISLLSMLPRFVPGIPLPSVVVPIVAALPCAAIVLLAILLPQWRWKWVDVSYGVYIYHYLAIMIAVAIGLSAWLIWCIGLVGGLFLGIASWYVIESPALRYKNAILRKSAIAPTLT